MKDAPFIGHSIFSRTTSVATHWLTNRSEKTKRWRRNNWCSSAVLSRWLGGGCHSMWMWLTSSMWALFFFFFFSFFFSSRFPTTRLRSDSWDKTQYVSSPHRVSMHSHRQMSVKNISLLFGAPTVSSIISSASLDVSASVSQSVQSPMCPLLSVWLCIKFLSSPSAVCAFISPPSYYLTVFTKQVLSDSIFTAPCSQGDGKWFNSERGGGDWGLLTPYVDMLQVVACWMSGWVRNVEALWAQCSQDQTVQS